MSTSSSNKAQSDNTLNPAPFYKQAVQAIRPSLKHFAQFLIMDRVKCTWGELVLRKEIDPSTGKNKFSLHVSPDDTKAHHYFDIDAKVVGEAIANDRPMLLACLESSPEAISLISNYVPAAASALQALALARAAPIASAAVPAKSARL